jgi:hypothetical protein
MKKIRVTGVQILTPSMRFLNTFFNFSKLILLLKAQVCNILKNHIDVQIFLLNTDFLNYAIHKWFLHTFDIFINKGSMTRTKVSPTVPNLSSNDEITWFDGGSNESSKIPGLYPLCFVICSVIHFKILLCVPKCPIRSLDLVTITILYHLFGCFRYALLSFLCLAKKQEENVIHITTLPGVFVLITMPGKIPRNKTCGWVFAVYGEYANRHKNEPISANFWPIPKKFWS